MAQSIALAPPKKQAKNPKRLSAPAQTLATTGLKNRVNNDSKHDSPDLNSKNASNLKQNDNNNLDDFFDLFSPDNNNNNAKNNNNNNKNNNANNNNPFDENPFEILDETFDDKNKNNNSNKDFVNPYSKRDSGMQPDLLFDPNMLAFPQLQDNNSNNNNADDIFDFGNNETQKPLQLRSSNSNPLTSSNNNNNNNNNNNSKKNSNKFTMKSSLETVKEDQQVKPDKTKNKNNNKKKNDNNNNDNDDNNDEKESESSSSKEGQDDKNIKELENVKEITNIKEGANNNENDKGNANNANATNALEELHRGTALLKYPRHHGFPHFKFVQLSKDNCRVQWFSKKKPLNETCISIKDIKEIIHGQQTEPFKKYNQKSLDKASFSIIHSNKYLSLDVVAKSIDEALMWVRTLILLKKMYEDNNKNEEHLKKLNFLDVGVQFHDRNRPKSRQGSGNFIRGNNSATKKVDPFVLKQIEKDMDILVKTFKKVSEMVNGKDEIVNSNEYVYISYVLSELEERIEELTHEVRNTRDTELSKRDVWRANVDITALQEKVEALIKYGVPDDNNVVNKRKSNIF